MKFKSAKILDSVFTFTAVLPALWLCLFVSFIARARIELGYWPVPMNPDPKSLGFGLHNDMLWYILFFLPLTLILVPILGVLARRRGARGNIRKIVVFAAGWASLFVILFFDPWRFLNWFFD